MSATETGHASGWEVVPNNGYCWPVTEGRWIYRAWCGARTLEGCMSSRRDAEQEARNTERQLVNESAVA